jgi:protein-tyrosine-phosphatase
MTLRLLKGFNYETKGLRSKDWQEFAQPESPRLDFAFTVYDKAAGEVCPVWPGQPMTAHWGAEDPVAFEGPEEKALNYFKEVYLTLESRIKIFVHLHLPFTLLDRLTLQGQLDAIGKTQLHPGAAKHSA